MSETYIYSENYFGQFYWTDNYWAKFIAKFIFVPFELRYSVPAEELGYTVPKEELNYTVPAGDLSYTVPKPK